LSSLEEKMDTHEPEKLDTGAYTVYVRHNENDYDQGDDQYVQRYFVPYPFCGLKWFRLPPHEVPKMPLEVERSKSHDEGWVYGGDVFIVHAKPLPIESGPPFSTHWFPFELTVKSLEREMTTMKLATRTADMRNFWLGEIDIASRTQTYLSACYECHSPPSVVVFNSTLQREHEIVVENYPLKMDSLGSLVMFCRLNKAEGAGLTAIALENTRLSDKHMALISSFLAFTPNLEELALTENLITNAGLCVLLPNMEKCRKLSIVNFSSNFISDKGCFELAKVLENLPKLRVLRMSRNQLTKASTKKLIFHLNKHDSQLEELDLSYNNVGDGAAALASLLMTINKPKLMSVDLSFCGITGDGIQALEEAVRHCPSIKNVSLKGTALRDTRLTGLVDALSAQWMRFSAQEDAAINISLGGVTVDPSGILEGSVPSTMRALLMGVDKDQRVVELKLKRRGATPCIYKDAYPANAWEAGNFSSTHIIPSQQESVFLHWRNMDVVCVRVQLPPHIQSNADFLQELALVLGADARQLRPLSCSDVDDLGTMFVVFSPQYPTDQVIQDHANRRTSLAFQKFRYNMAAAQALKTAPVSVMENESRRAMVISQFVVGLRPEEVDAKLADLPTPNDMLRKMKRLSSTNHPSICTLGIRSVALLAARDPLNGDDGIVDEMGGKRTEEGPVVLGSERVRDVASALQYMPPLAPTEPTAQQLAKATGNAGSCTTESMLSSAAFTSRSSRSSRPDLEHLSDASDDDDDEDFVIDLGLFVSESGELRDVGSILRHMDEDISVLETSRMIRGINSAGWRGQAGKVVGRQENDVENVKQSQRILAAVVFLEQRKQLSVSASHFWQGVFGLAEFDHEVTNIVDAAIAPAPVTASLDIDGDAMAPPPLMHAVHTRNEMRAAIAARDLPKLELLLEENGKEPVPVEGNVTILAYNMANDLRALIREGKALQHLVQGPQDMDKIERYLQSCAQRGFNGPHVVAAATMRERLLKEHALSLTGQQQTEFLSRMAAIKKDAMLTNMMITRDMDGLKRLLQSEDASVVIPAERLSRALVEELGPLDRRLNRLTASGASLDEVESALALAVYSFGAYRSNAMLRAHEYMLDLGGDASTLLVHLCRAMLDGDLPKVIAGLAECRRVGWHEGCLAVSTVRTILNQRDLLTRETAISERLQELARRIKNGDTADLQEKELREIYLLSRSLNLHLDPGKKQYVDVVAQFIVQLKKTGGGMNLLGIFTANKGRKGLMQQTIDNLGLDGANAELLELIEMRDTAGIRLLLRRGGGVALVVAAESEESQREWLGHLRKATNPDHGKAIYYAGFMAKTAKAKTTGTVSKSNSWMRRYFVLQDGVLTYSMHMGGAAKGTVRVQGAEVKPLPRAEVMRSNAILVREGIDLTRLDPQILQAAQDLLKEADRDVAVMELRVAVEQYADDTEVVESAYLAAMAYGNLVDADLKAHAEAAIKQRRAVAVMFGMRAAIVHAQRFTLADVLHQADDLHLSSDAHLYHICARLKELDQTDLKIVRARNMLGTDASTVLELATANRTQGRDGINLGEAFALLVAPMLNPDDWNNPAATTQRLSGAQRKMLLGVLMQRCGASVATRLFSGQPLVLAANVLAYALSTIVEPLGEVSTEAVNLAKSLDDMLLMDDEETLEDGDSEAMITTTKQQVGAVAKVVFQGESSPLVHPYMGSRFALPRCSLLAANKEIAGEKKTKAEMLRKKHAHLMEYSTKELSQPLLTFSKKDAAHCVGAFELLQVFMGTRKKDFMGRVAKILCQDLGNKKVIKKEKLGVVDVASVLLRLGGAEKTMADELVLQLCKQLNVNPDSMSRRRGWRLMVLYLHAFHPSAKIMPYILSFFHSSLLDEERHLDEALGNAGKDTSVSRQKGMFSRGVTENELAAARREALAAVDVLSVNVQGIAYALRLLQRARAAYLNDETVAAYEKDVLNDGLHANLPLLKAVLVNRIVSFEVVLMTGSIYRIECRVLDCATLLECLSMVYMRMLGARAANELDPDDVDKDGQRLEQAYMGMFPLVPSGRLFSLSSAQQDFASLTSAERAELLSTVFRGCVFTECPEDAVMLEKRYKTDASHALYGKVHEDDESGYKADVREVPLQPDMRGVISWDSDVAWRLVEAEVEDRLAQDERKEEAAGRFRASNPDEPYDSDVDVPPSEDEASMGSGSYSEDSDADDNDESSDPDSDPDSIDSSVDSNSSDDSNSDEPSSDEDSEFGAKKKKKEKKKKKKMKKKKKEKAPNKVKTKTDKDRKPTKRLGSMASLRNSLSLELTEKLRAENRRKNAMRLRKDYSMGPSSKRRMVLRALSMGSSEALADPLDLFGFWPGPREVQVMDSLWRDWLKSSAPLPPDVVRVDLKFAEETRYANNVLYNNMNVSASQAFLLAIQLTLAWKVDSNASRRANAKNSSSRELRFGSPFEWTLPGETTVAYGADLSVRPCNRQLAGYPARLRPRPVAYSSKQDPTSVHDWQMKRIQRLLAQTGGKLGAALVGAEDLDNIMSYDDHQDGDAASTVSFKEGAGDQLVMLKGSPRARSPGAMSGIDDGATEISGLDNGDEGVSPTLMNRLLHDEDNLPSSMGAFDIVDSDDSSSGTESSDDSSFQFDSDQTVSDDDDSLARRRKMDKVSEMRAHGNRSAIRVSDVGLKAAYLLNPKTTTPAQIKALEDLCDVIGFGLSEDELAENDWKHDVFLDQLVGYVSALQAIATECGVKPVSSHYRYLLKRAYLQYLSCWPLAGSRYFEGDLTSIAKPDGSNAIEDVPLVINLALSETGIMLLDSEDWSVVYNVRWHEVEGMRFEEEEEDDDDSDDSNEKDNTESTFFFTVRETEFSVVLGKGVAAGVKELAWRFQLEALAVGAFEHGSEGGLGADIFRDDDMQLAAPTTGSFTLGAVDGVGKSNFVRASDPKVRFDAYLRDFSVLPTPPAPPQLYRSSKHLYDHVRAEEDPVVGLLDEEKTETGSLDEGNLSDSDSGEEDEDETAFASAINAAARARAPGLLAHP
jgi:hypothetical protein